MGNRASFVKHWRRTFDYARRRRAGPLTPISLIVDAPSPVMSDWSDDSVDTVMDGASDPLQGVYNVDPPYVENRYEAVSHFE